MLLEYLRNSVGMKVDGFFFVFQTMQSESQRVGIPTLDIPDAWHHRCHKSVNPRGFTSQDPIQIR